MSTYLYLECLEHDPPVRSHGEVGQHVYDLPRVQREIADRDRLVAIARDYEFVDFASHFTMNAIRFFVEHPRCRIGVRDEYGRQHPAGGEQ